jgi:hypothetical protein
MEGDNTDHQLFGQNLIPDTGVRLTIYEGELDAASGYAAQPTWPHVSIPHGAAGAKKDLQKVLPLLQGYEEIVLFFDGDTAGIQAAQDCSAILPPGKAKIARLEKYKDASDALQQGDMDAIRRAIYDTQTYRPDGIVEGKSLKELVSTPNLKCIHEYPFKGLNEKLHGIRYGNLSPLLVALVQERPASVVTLQLTSCKKGNGMGSWKLEAVIRNTALGIMSCAGEYNHVHIWRPWTKYEIEAALS